jgi:hypothetical protein
MQEKQSGGELICGGSVALFRGKFKFVCAELVQEMRA